MNTSSPTQRQRLHSLTASELLVPGGEKPEVIETSQGRFVVTFDREELLAARQKEPVERAILSGRVLVQALKGQGVGVALNIGDASEHLFDAESIEWLNEVLDESGEDGETHLGTLTPPHASPEFFAALDEAIGRLPGLAREAWLFRNDDVLTLAISGVDDRAETAVSRAFADAVRISGWEEDFAVVFADLSGEPSLESVAIRIEIPQEEAAPPKPVDQPPRLR